MNARRDSGKSATRSSRGQSATIGLVLLIGVVAAGSLAILTFGGQMIGQTEQQAEQERIEQAFVELSHTMSTASADGDSTRTIEFDAGEKGAVAMTDAGRIHVSVGDNNVTKDDPIQMGAIEYEADDGSIVAYQAGGVWRETGEETRMLSPPSINYDDESNTLTLPVTTVSDQQELTSGEVTVDPVGPKNLEVDNFVEGRVVTLEIKSEYYRGWEMFFEEEVDGAAVEVDPHKFDGDTGYLEVELGVQDLEDAFDSGVTVSDEDGYGDGGNVNKEGDLEKGTSYPPLDDVIGELVDETSEDNETENLGIINETVTLSNGTYFADEVALGNHDELEFNLSDGNATLIVDGDVNVTRNNAELSVDPEGTNNSLKIYATGNLKMSDGEVGTGTADAGASHLQVYGTSEMSVGITGGTFEGVIYAPSDDWDENEVVDRSECKDYQVCLHSNPDFTGSIVAHSVFLQGGDGEGEGAGGGEGEGNLNFEYDNQLQDLEPEVHPEGYVADITYLNVAVHEVNVEN